MKAKTLSFELNQRKYTYINKIFHGATIPKMHYNLILTHTVYDSARYPGGRLLYSTTFFQPPHTHTLINGPPRIRTCDPVIYAWGLITSDFALSKHCFNRPVSQMRAPPGGLSRTSGKLWQDYSNCYMFSSSSSKFYFQQNTTMEQYQEKENTL